MVTGQKPETADLVASLVVSDNGSIELIANKKEDIEPILRLSYSTPQNNLT